MMYSNIGNESLYENSTIDLTRDCVLNVFSEMQIAWVNHGGAGGQSEQSAATHVSNCSGHMIFHS
jgi:hypothetical protein